MPIIDARGLVKRPRGLRAARITAFTLALGRKARLMALDSAFGSALALASWWAALPAHAEAPAFSFAVIANTMQSPADEASTQRLIDAIGRERGVSFIVYDGNLKGAKEACRDALYERRHAVLETSRPALFFVPGQHDWVDCASAQAGGFDPVERLDQLRQTLLGDADSMGQNPIPLTRESEVSRFRPYRENVRWQVGDTVFVGLNAPSPNNHYLTAGGRNGEFEDRVIANAFWLEHAGEYAKRRGARAIVVFIQGDPDPERYERPERFAWLRFGRNPRRDGFLEFKRSLVKLAQIFHGPVLVIHSDDERASAGFLIDQPLRNDKGNLVTNLTRIALAPHDRLNQWIQIDVDFDRRPPLRVTLRDVPRQMPMPATPPPLQRDEPAASMPAVPSLGPASELPPLLQPPGQPQPDSQPLEQLPRIPADQGGGGYGPATAIPPAQRNVQGAPGAWGTSGVPGAPASSVQRGP
ncbi:hypothetical protein [Paraburkholderia phenoliruptrix]|uniref:Calcineurin-like phosphoesterase domain-containing protein n=2 Tax=Paraburkholderia phenoliruptrix TaxID=252970 RepID=A0A6J5KBS3_9BURK|nr:hypothetical protein [Paraburkholderia phenoliruptrix]AFT86388.1 hypothetical protein BUPH_02808 [Paraburkholderia phenoliruptrix BR3459a]CAB4051298.1 hypothetical protein LMG9964_04975 [Paraburkholderia phenoliruptrix]